MIGRVAEKIPATSGKGRAPESGGDRAGAEAAARLHRVMAALEQLGEALRGDDAEWMLLGIRAALMDPSTTIEDGLGLTGRWRGSVRAAQRAALPALAPGAESARAAARELRSKLIRYRARDFESANRAASVPPGEAGNLFRILASHGGKVPSVSALRDLLSGQESPLFPGHGADQGGDSEVPNGEATKRKYPAPDRRQAARAANAAGRDRL